MENIFLDPVEVRQLEELESEYKKHTNRVYLPNIKPTRKVDYIFIGTEPSIGRWAKTAEEANKHIDNGFRNFIFSLEDFIFKYAIEKYLLPSYYITDISKFAIRTKEAHQTYPKTWLEGLPLLLKEIETYKYEKTKIISIGQSQMTFLKESDIIVDDCLLHFSTQNSGRRRKSIDENEFQKFQNDIPSLADLLHFAKSHLDSNFIPTIIQDTIILKNLHKAKTLTIEKQRLLFYLFKKFIQQQSEWDNEQSAVYAATSYKSVPISGQDLSKILPFN